MNPFERNKVIKTVEDVKRLAERFSQCPEVTRFDEGQYREASALADSFADWESSFRVFLDEQLPRLAQKGLEPSEVYDLLLDIGEDFRHILYHILEQQKFYRYLVAEGTNVSDPPQ